MDKNNILTETKHIIRSLLLSCPEKITIKQLCADYRELNGKTLPYQDFGYTKPIDFVRSLSDVVRMEWIPSRNDFGLSAVADNSTQHIQKMVARQKRRRKRRKPGVIVRPQAYAKCRSSLTDPTFANDLVKKFETQDTTIKTATVGNQAIKPKPTYSQVIKSKPTDLQKTKPKTTDLQETKPKPTDLQETKPKPTDLQESKPKTTDLQESKPKTTDLQETKPKQKKTFIWTSKATKLLLYCMLKINGDFQKCNGTTKLWKKVAFKMKHIGSYNVTSRICNKKWNRLVNTYQKFENSQTNEANWKYFDKIDAILGFKNSIFSDKENLMINLPETLQNCTTAADPMPSSSANPMPLSPKLKNKFAKQEEDNIGLLEYLKKKEEDEQIRWKEYKKLQEAKIKAINNVANALLQYKKSEK